MKLSTHFSLEELTHSDTAVSLGIDNLPNEDQTDCLKNLCDFILEPIRESFGVPFSPNSGFRSQSLNKALGGSSSSQHLDGKAADIEISSVDNKELALWIRDHLDFDQLILERYNGGVDSGWVHVSFNGTSNRGDVLRFDGDSYHFGIEEEEVPMMRSRDKLFIVRNCLRDVVSHWRFKYDRFYNGKHW